MDTPQEIQGGLNMGNSETQCPDSSSIMANAAHQDNTAGHCCLPPLRRSRLIFTKIPSQTYPAQVLFPRVHHLKPSHSPLCLWNHPVPTVSRVQDSVPGAVIVLSLLSHKGGSGHSPPTHHNTKQSQQAG